MKIITIINQKGGVAKTSSALTLGYALKKKGNKVLLVDLDAQGNLSYSLGANIEGYNVLGAMQRPETSLDEIQSTPLGDILPSTPALSGADSLLNETGKEYRLREVLERIDQDCDYDFVVIDTPPSLGVVTVNALTASHYVLIPAQADIFSLQGITQLNNTIQAVKKYTNPNLKILGIVLTRYNGRATLTKELTSSLENTAKQLNTKVYKNRIRENISIKEAQALQKNLFEYAPKSNGSIDYGNLVNEILEDIEP